MIHTLSLRIPPERLPDRDELIRQAAGKIGCAPEEIDTFQILRRSLDARGRAPVFELRVAAGWGGALPDLFVPAAYRPVTSGRQAVVVGSGPAGLFAALTLISSNIRPVILERGKDVRERRFDLKTINTDGICHPDSNYCFGEGGAGTYSDGKLFTRATKRGSVKEVLSVLVQHGAAVDILVDAHPHIGSNRLPKIIAAMRKTILECNGEIHFNTRITDLIISERAVKGVRSNDREFPGDAVILATGHSARDVYELLDRHGIRLEAKPFALGVRVEHPQALINTIQYGPHASSPHLPAASYSLAAQFRDTGVYSFCMCPGGMLVPAATAPGELVLNGMSNSARNLPRANAGMVVSVDHRLWQPYEKEKHFAGLRFQQDIETRAFEAGGRTLAAPAQRLTDFLADRLSSDLPATSYLPGTVSYPVREILGPFITDMLKQGFIQFGRKMNGYITKEALVLAPESRTSSPVRIPRDPKTRMHPDRPGLFPAGEGAGYSGGIVSSALDGRISAQAAAAFIS